MYPSCKTKRCDKPMRRRQQLFESLEPRQMLDASFEISEFMADNDLFLLDGYGASSDWIEIHNAGDEAGNLVGWYLTDRADNLTKWSFPDLELLADEYAIVFASGRSVDDIVDPDGNLHANFKLSRTGEYLALVKPDGTTIASEFGAADRDYPEQFENVSYGIGRRMENGENVAVGHRFFVSPTPRLANSEGVNNSGPAIDEVVHTPHRPRSDEDVIVTARIANAQLQFAHLNYRIMYADEQSLLMVDDGSGADSTAGDGIFAAAIPASAFDAGDMIRYYVRTSDSQNNPARKPEFLLAERSAEYFGTVAIDPTIPETKLPILEWFVEDPRWHREPGGNNRDYTFASIVYNGRFYDNIRIRVRGGVTSQQAKPNFKFDFYSGGRFEFDASQPSVEEFNIQSLMGEIPTRTYMRNPLAYQLFRDTGHAAPLSFYTHLRQNGEFYGLVAIDEQIDATFLEKHGFDPEGALYKASTDAMLQINPTSDMWNKGTRLHEDFSDLAAFADGLAIDDLDERTRFVFDNVNIPQVIHYLAVSLLGPNHDRITHNYYVYRDTNDTGEWSIFPWDMDRFFPQGSLLTDSTASPIFYGDSDHPRWPGSDSQRFNRLNDAIFDIPATRTMFVAHLNSVFDEWMNSSYLEESVDAIAELIDLDVTLDQSKWRLGGLRSGVAAIKNTIETRRRQLANDPELQGSGTVLVDVGSPVSILIPTNDDLGTTWTNRSFAEGGNGETWIPGNYAVGFDRGTALDAMIDTDIEEAMFERQKSVFIRSEFEYDGGPLKELNLSIQYDDAFVAYLNGQEIARSENLDAGPVTINAEVNQAHNARNAERFDVSAFLDQLVEGENVLAIHVLNTDAGNRDVFVAPQLSAIPNADLSTIDIVFGEIDASPVSTNQDEEFITLVNTESVAIDISSWTLQGGVSHQFQPGTVLPPGGKLFVSPNVAAFRNRASGPSGGQGLFVQGNYDGDISDSGETIELVDRSGQVIATVNTEDSPQIDADLNADGTINAADIDLLSAAIRAGEDRFDLNEDGQVDDADRTFMIETVLKTTIGDSNLDGVFNSRDLIVVFEASQFEDAIVGNSGWAEGDWNGDGDFTTADLVTAFQRDVYSTE